MIILRKSLFYVLDLLSSSRQLFILVVNINVMVFTVG